MPSSFFLTKMIIFLVALLITGGLAWYFWYTIPVEGGGVVREVEARLNELRRIKERQIETSLLKEKIFQDLRAPASPVQESLTPGRPNPFAYP